MSIHIGYNLLFIITLTVTATFTEALKCFPVLQFLDANPEVNNVVKQSEYSSKTSKNYFFSKRCVNFCITLP